MQEFRSEPVIHPATPRCGRTARLTGIEESRFAADKARSTTATRIGV